MTQPGSSSKSPSRGRAGRERSKSAVERERLNALLDELTVEADQLRAAIRRLRCGRDSKDSATEHEQRLEAMRRRRASILLALDRVKADLDSHGVSSARNLLGGVRRIELGGSPALDWRR